jgi:hypothetical protein
MAREIRPLAFQLRLERTTRARERSSRTPPRSSSARRRRPTFLDIGRTVQPAAQAVKPSETTATDLRYTLLHSGRDAHSDFTFGATVRTKRSMPRNVLLPLILVACVASPAYLVGQRLRHDDPPVLALTLLIMTVVLVASAIMRQMD